MISTVTMDQPPVEIGTLPLLVMVMITTYPPTIAVTTLANALNQIDIVPTVCHASITPQDQRLQLLVPHQTGCTTPSWVS